MTDLIQEQKVCEAPKKHAWGFVKNRTFRVVKHSLHGTTMAISVGGIYKCKDCGKLRRGKVQVGEPGDSL